MMKKDIAIGQTWRLSSGAKVTIEAFDAMDDTYPWRDNEHEWYGNDGWRAGSRNTVFLEEKLSDSPPVAVGAMVALGADPAYAEGGVPGFTTAANDGNVGDIKSDAKGSGARFNAGKPPFELIPFGILARYYRQSVVGKDAEIDALEFLGKFQARDGADNLMKAAISLGGGWDECAKVFDYGRIKYAENNWTKGMKWSVPMACAARHLIAMILGEEYDAESGLPHRGHFLCNVVMLATFEKTYAEGDNRARAGRFLPSAVAE